MKTRNTDILVYFNIILYFYRLLVYVNLEFILLLSPFSLKSFLVLFASWATFHSIKFSRRFCFGPTHLTNCTEWSLLEPGRPATVCRRLAPQASFHFFLYIICLHSCTVSGCFCFCSHIAQLGFKAMAFSSLFSIGILYYTKKFPLDLFFSYYVSFLHFTMLYKLCDYFLEYLTIFLLLSTWIAL